MTVVFINGNQTLLTSKMTEKSKKFSQVWFNLNPFKLKWHIENFCAIPLYFRSSYALLKWYIKLEAGVGGGAGVEA